MPTHGYVRCKGKTQGAYSSAFPHTLRVLASPSAAFHLSDCLFLIVFMIVELFLRYLVVFRGEEQGNVSLHHHILELLEL